MPPTTPTQPLTGAGSFAAEVEAESRRGVRADAGANLLKCYQCRKCTSGCPVAARVDIKPHELLRLVQMGMRGDVLASRMIWECTSCQTCFARCPQGVSIASMIDALRRMSRRENLVTGATTVPTFNDIFLKTIRKRGRMYEMGLMTKYKLRTGRLFADVSKFPMMVRKGKLPFFGPKLPNRGARKAMFQRAADAQKAADQGGDR